MLSAVCDRDGMAFCTYSLLNEMKDAFFSRKILISFNEAMTCLFIMWSVPQIFSALHHTTVYRFIDFQMQSYATAKTPSLRSAFCVKTTSLAT